MQPGTGSLQLVIMGPAHAGAALISPCVASGGGRGEGKPGGTDLHSVAKRQDLGVWDYVNKRNRHEAATWFNTNFDIKAAKASSDSERWRVSSERKRFLQVHSTIVARRNAAIFDYNAWPKMGGEMPRAPRVQYE